MSATRTTVDAAAREFISGQRLFFVATAPLSAEGLINLSPKGLDTLRILGPSRVAYLDYTGSGVETIAHVRENGRIVIMFCSFGEKPNILRLHGRGRAGDAGSAEFAGLLAGVGWTPAHAERAGIRAVIVMEVQRVADSCGFGVPRYEFVADRDLMDAWAAKKGADGLRDYRKLKNTKSLDGLPGLSAPA